MSTAVLTRHADAICPEQPWFVLNAARHYALIASRHPAISHFYSFEVAPEAALTLAIPDGCVDIVFDCDSARPQARACGSTLSVRNAALLAGHRYFGVRFAPGVMPDFLDVMAEELTDHAFNVFEVMPDARAACEQILRTPQFCQQVALFNQHFSARLMRRMSPATAAAVRALLQQQGNLRVDQLEALTGYTCRTLQRLFRHDTGLTPKAFGRIIRCQAALNRLHAPVRCSFTDLALELGFSDQSHFLREFKTLVSMTPLEFCRRATDADWATRLSMH